MDKYLKGSWEEFEQWIRFTIGMDFRWRVRPLDCKSVRIDIVELIRADIKNNKGVFPRQNLYIERV